MMPSEEISWTPMTESTSSTMISSVQPLIQGAVISSGSEYHLSVVFLGCGYALQNGLASSTASQRVSFLRDVPPTMFMTGRQRELVISCGRETAIHPQILIDFSTKKGTCGHPFCSETGRNVDNINWLKRSLILLRPISETLMESNEATYRLSEHRFALVSVFNTLLTNTGYTMKEHCPFIQDYISTFVIVYGYSVRHYTGTPLRIGTSKRRSSDHIRVHRLWLIQSAPKHGLPELIYHENNVVGTFIDLTKVSDKGRLRSKRMFDVPLRNQTQQLIFTSSGLKLSQQVNAPKVMRLHDCADIKVSY